jgi:S-adenosylmethionine:diacylglycerol 3-amino-3-carboxypropyl transferase
MNPAQTPWETGRLGTANGPQKLLFGHMSEDAQIERNAFRGRRRVFCIASAGCTAISLSDEHEVVACDINPVQLDYARRRAEGSPAQQGEADCALAAARALMPLVGWHRKTLRQFLALADVGEQVAFWRRHLDTRRFRAGFDLLMSPVMLRAVYAPQFLSFLPPNFGAVLRGRLDRSFARHANATNPYAKALFLGEWEESRHQPTTPPQFVHADAASYLETCAPASFDGFSLSNILDGVDPAYRTRLLAAVRRAASPGSATVLRSFSEPPPGLTANYADQDRAMLWGTVTVQSANSCGKGCASCQTRFNGLTEIVNKNPTTRNSASISSGKS